MALGMSTALRNARLTAIITAADANNSAGDNAKIKLYAGTRPATGGTATTLLGTFNCANPLGSVSAGVLTFGSVAADSSADATGVATWARLETRTGTHVMDLSVTATGGGGDLTMDNPSVTIGATLTPASITITDANP